MKKLLFVLGIVLSMAYAAHGQVEIKGLVGINFASLSNPRSGSDWQAQAGYPVCKKLKGHHLGKCGGRF